MTVRISHPTHKWDSKIGECRQCACGVATVEAAQPCPEAAPIDLKKRISKKRKAGLPNLHAAGIQGAKDLVRK